MVKKTTAVLYFAFMAISVVYAIAGFNRDNITGISVLAFTCIIAFIILGAEKLGAGSWHMARMRMVTAPSPAGLLKFVAWIIFLIPLIIAVYFRSFEYALIFMERIFTGSNI